MKEYRLTDWLPTTRKEVELRGWDELDVILVSGDALCGSSVIRGSRHRAHPRSGRFACGDYTPTQLAR